MKLSNDKKVIFLFSFFLSVLIFYTLNINGMEGAIEGAGARALLERLPGGEEALNALNRNLGREFGSASGDLLKNSPEIRSIVQSEAEAIVTEIKAELQQGVKPQNIDLGKIVNNAGADFRIQVKGEIAEGITPQDKMVLEQFPGVEHEIANVPEVANEVRLAGNERISPEEPKAVAAATKIDTLGDEVLARESQLQELYRRFRPQEDINAIKGRIEEAKNTFNEQSTKELERFGPEVEKANGAVKNAKIEGKPKEKVAILKKAAKDKIKESEQAIKTKAYQEFKQAQAERATAKEELEHTKQVSKGSPEEKTRIDEAQKKYDAATTKYYEARKDLFEKSGTFEQISEKTWGRFRDASSDKWESIERKFVRVKGKITLENAWEGTKSIPGKAWGGAKWLWNHEWTQAFVTAFVFTFPSMILDSIQAYFKNEANLDTMRLSHSFGNIWMKLLDDFINEAEPLNSLFVFVGVPNKGQKLTKEFLATANYYVGVPDYGDIKGDIGFIPNPPTKMLHLNTGFVFVGDGIPFNEEEPTVPLFEDRGNQRSLKSTLDELAGKVSQGESGVTYEYFQIDKATGYSGNPQVGRLFKSPSSAEDAYPPLMQPTIVALQNGTQFAKYNLQGIRGLDAKNRTGIEKNRADALWNLLTQGSEKTKSEQVAAVDDPYVAYGVYIYQTKDTPFIKTIQDSIAPDNVDEHTAAQELVDYVIVLFEDGSTLKPLQIPKPAPPANYASYALNHDAYYMISLLDPALTMYYSTGQDKDNKKFQGSGGLAGVLGLLENQLKVLEEPKFRPLLQQILFMQSFCQSQAQYGPFSYGSVKMYITKELLEEGIYIYKIPGYLGKDTDDYVIALDKTNKVIKLPASVNNFVSLVTSRIYDGSLRPVNTMYSYYIAKTASSTPFVTTSDPATKGWTLVCEGGKAPLYTLFVEGPFNPNKCKGQDLPNGPDWALNAYSFPPKEKGGNPILINEHLKENNAALLTTIQKAHDAWKQALDKSDPMIVARQMGPFDFTKGLQNVQIKAVSEAAIINQNFVYVSDSYPDEYLVLARDAQGVDAGKAYDISSPQQFAVSLSNGFVYAAQAQEGKVPGEKVEQPSLDVDKLMNQLKSVKPLLPDLLSAVKRSQALYTNSILRNLYGTDTFFAQFKFYLAKQDYLAGQYIYGNVAGLGVPLGENGNEVKSIVDQIHNYYVCIERKALPETCEGCQPWMIGSEQQKDKDGKLLYWHYTFGNQLSADTYAVASLITGASYDRDNSYLGTYDQFKIKSKDTIVDILAFTTKMLADIEAKSKKPIRGDLVNKIKSLTSDFVKKIQREEDQLKDAERKQQEDYVPFSAIVKKALDELDGQGNPKIPYLDNPNLIPRYIKYYKPNGKYYAVTPGYVSTPRPDEISEHAWGPDRSYIDYNLDVPGQGATKDTYKGMVYDADGNAVLLLGPAKQWVKSTEIDPDTKKPNAVYKKVLVGPGWALLNARSYAGVVVKSNGTQKRTLGITAPTIPMAADYLKPTGFDQLQDPSNNTFDFYYHKYIDSYFVKVTTAKGNSSFINLTSGFGYNVDGTPKWFENPVFKNANNKGDLLLIGTDQFDILKVALHNAQDNSFSYYTMVGSFVAKIAKEQYNAKGTYCVMVSDNDPDQKIQLFNATNDAVSGQRLDNPYYLIWDSSKSDQAPAFVGKFDKDPKLVYSLLLYAQTRNKGEAVEAGVFDPAVNYIDPSATVKKPKTTGILYDSATRAFSSVLYNDQICPIQGTTIVVKNADKTTRTITITQNKQKLPVVAGAQQELSAQWLSLDDGNKINDYIYDYYILDPEPEVTTPGEAQHLNLYNLKRGRPGSKPWGFGLNVSSYVRPQKPKAADKEKTEPKEPASASALASYLEPSSGVSLQDIKFPPYAYEKDSKSLKSNISEIVGSNLSRIHLDDGGSIFINTIAKGVTKRFVYLITSIDDGQVFSAPGIKNWYVDLSNGILYDPKGFPIGESLMPLQLYALLDTLQLTVIYDQNGNPQLSYRTFTEDEAESLVDAFTHKKAPAPKPSLRTR